MIHQLVICPGGSLLLKLSFQLLHLRKAQVIHLFALLLFASDSPEFRVDIRGSGATATDLRPEGITGAATIIVTVNLAPVDRGFGRGGKRARGRRIFRGAGG